MNSLIALLGRADSPTDGLEDYCTFLAQALEGCDIHMSLVRVRWMEYGWFGGVRELWCRSSKWRGKWILLQYTALAWSRRGFPFGAILALFVLRLRGVRCAVVFHEPFGYGGVRWIDRIRTHFQNWIVRTLYRHAQKSIFADPLRNIAWLPTDQTKAFYVPIGANIPEPLPRGMSNQNGQKTVAIFCLSDSPHRNREINDISQATNLATANGVSLKLIFLGRGTPEATADIERAFQGSSIQVLNLGLCTSEQIARVLSESDAMLCVRGQFFPRRGSALAGIACGLPIIAYAGAAEGALAEAGIELVPYGDKTALGNALVHILTDRNRWRELREKNLDVYRKHLAWRRIAAEIVRVLDYK
jgi:glycosyltransferase involved in cell wall biosynthesis